MPMPRWREYLSNAGKAHHPVLAPWLAFAGLPHGAVRGEGAGAGGAVRRQRAIRKVRSTRWSRRRSPAKPPATLAEVAKKYDARVQGRRKRRGRRRRKKQPAPTRLADADAEAVRQVLDGPGSPTDHCRRRDQPVLRPRPARPADGPAAAGRAVAGHRARRSAAGDGAGRCARRRTSRACSCAATRPTPARRCRGSSWRCCAGDAQAVREGQRPAGAGAGDRVARTTR